MANYTLNYSGEKVDELLNKIDTAFGEETVTKEAITWDGNTDGLDSVMGLYFRVSSCVPTIEDLQKGGTISWINSEETTTQFTADGVMSLEDIGGGTDTILVQGDGAGLFIATTDEATIIENNTTIPLGKAGIYFMGAGGEYISSFSINNYTFTETEIKTIDSKYLPSGGNKAVFSVVGSLDQGNIEQTVLTCDKTFEELNGMTLEELNSSCVYQTNGAGVDRLLAVQNVTKVSMQGTQYVLFDIIYITTGTVQCFSIQVLSDGTIKAVGLN